MNKRDKKRRLKAINADKKRRSEKTRAARIAQAKAEAWAKACQELSLDVTAVPQTADLASVW
jgi:hypothetical protein